MLTGFGFALLLIAFELYMGYQMATPPGKVNEQLRISEINR